MQPYFLPYIGYFSLIKHTDRFLLFDECQYIKQGWINRNRVQKQMEGWTYIYVPLKKHSDKILIKDVLIDNTHDWKTKIKNQLILYKKTAPFYKPVVNILDSIFSFDYIDIVSLNKNSLVEINKYLNINTPIDVLSNLNLQYKKANQPDEWGINVCKCMNDVTEFWNASGGIVFFDPNKYVSENVTLRFLTSIPVEYQQINSPFERYLSIIDVLMMNSIETVHQMLDNYQLVSFDKNGVSCN